MEYYQAAQIFDGYGDDLKIQDPYGCDVAESNQQIYEGIHFTVHEQPELVYDSYTSIGSMEDEDHLVNFHNDVFIDVVEGTCEQIQDKFGAFDFQCMENLHSLFPIEQMKYHFINGAEKQYDFCISWKYSITGKTQWLFT